MRPWCINMRKRETVPRILADDLMVLARGAMHAGRFKEAFGATHKHVQMIGAKNCPRQVSHVLDMPQNKKNVERNSQKEIWIKDNGPGIPDEILDNIFVPFFTTKEGGSGIGLSLSKQIMRLHGGTVSVQSSASGTTFKLHF